MSLDGYSRCAEGTQKLALGAVKNKKGSFYCICMKAKLGEPRFSTLSVSLEGVRDGGRKLSGSSQEASFLCKSVT